MRGPLTRITMSGSIRAYKRVRPLLTWNQRRMTLSLILFSPISSSSFPSTSSAFPEPIPYYDRPSTWQTGHIPRALKTISNRMYTAEDTLALINASENSVNSLDAKNRHGLGDIPQPSNPSAESSQGSLSPPLSTFDVTTSLETFSSSGTPLVPDHSVIPHLKLTRILMPLTSFVS